MLVALDLAKSGESKMGTLDQKLADIRGSVLYHGGPDLAAL